MNTHCVPSEFHYIQPIGWVEFKYSLKDAHKAMEPGVKTKASNSRLSSLVGTHYMAFDDVCFVSCLLTTCGS